MDDDKKIIKNLKSVYKYLKFNLDHRSRNILTLIEGNNLIYRIIKSGEPSMIVRLGSVETHCLYPWMKGIAPPNRVLKNGMYCAGIFPPNKKENDIFSEIYSSAISQTDLMALCGVYMENKVINKFCPNANFIKARSIEPYYFENPWSRILQGKRILIVHPFTESIKKQYLRRNQIFKSDLILPQFNTLEVIRAVQSNAGAESGFKNWNSAYNYMCKEIKGKEFDIAIIGAGAYGLPLAAYVKSLGKIAVQMSGATQLLFGIKGKRWDNHPIISKIYNDAWIRPSLDETPPRIEKVEGGSYW